MKTRHSGRQIPADLAILSVLSLSLILGIPLARRLGIYFLATPRIVLLFFGVALGFLILVSIYKTLDFYVLRFSERKTSSKQENLTQEINHDDNSTASGEPR